MLFLFVLKVWTTSWTVDGFIGSISAFFDELRKQLSWVVSIPHSSLQGMQLPSLLIMSVIFLGPGRLCSPNTNKEMFVLNDFNSCYSKHNIFSNWGNQTCLFLLLCHISLKLLQKRKAIGETLAKLPAVPLIWCSWSVKVLQFLIFMCYIFFQITCCSSYLTFFELLVAMLV